MVLEAVVDLVHELGGTRVVGACNGLASAISLAMRHQPQLVLIDGGVARAEPDALALIRAGLPESSLWMTCSCCSPAKQDEGLAFGFDGCVETRRLGDALCRILEPLQTRA